MWMQKSVFGWFFNTNNQNLQVSFSLMVILEANQEKLKT